MLKDLIKIKANVELYKLLKEKEDQQEKRIEFRDLAALDFYAWRMFQFVDFNNK